MSHNGRYIVRHNQQLCNEGSSLPGCKPAAELTLCGAATPGWEFGGSSVGLRMGSTVRVGSSGGTATIAGVFDVSAAGVILHVVGTGTGMWDNGVLIAGVGAAVTFVVCAEFC